MHSYPYPPLVSYQISPISICVAPSSTSQSHRVRRTPKQRGYYETDGSYTLELPYADPRELVMDILRHVPEVDVLAPAALRDEVKAKLAAGLARVTP